MCVLECVGPGQRNLILLEAAREQPLPRLVAPERGNLNGFLSVAPDHDYHYRALWAGAPTSFTGKKVPATALN